MPFHIQGDVQITRIILSGQFTLAEISDLGRELERVEAGFEKIPDRLTDLSAIENSGFDYPTLERLSAEHRDRAYRNRFRSAIVAPRPLDFGLARIFQTLSSNPMVDLQIFRTQAEAEAWLAPSPGKTEVARPSSAVPQPRT